MTPDVGAVPVDVKNSKHLAQGVEVFSGDGLAVVVVKLVEHLHA